MASDPHRAYLMPSLRYVAHLRAPGLDVIGAGEPALPGISIGHNDKAAFSLTIFPIDQEDLYVYRTKPDDPDCYAYGDGFERMRIVEERVAVKGHPDQTVTLKFTRHGPIVHEDRARNLAYGVRTVWLEPGGAAYLSSLGYQDASSVEAFEQALQSWSVPATNQIYADVNGKIAWTPACKAPVRKGYDGMTPVPGDGRYEWDGFHSQKAFPREIAPARGYVASSNEMNLPPGPAQELNIGYEFTDPFRAQRSREVLDAKPKHTLEDSCRLQCDDLSIPARRVCAHLAGLTSADKDTAFGLSLLQGWDHHLADDSAAALLFEVWWMRHLKPGMLDLVSTDPKLRPLLAPGDHVTLLELARRARADLRTAARGEAIGGPARDARQGRGRLPAALRQRCRHMAMVRLASRLFRASARERASARLAKRRPAAAGRLRPDRDEQRLPPERRPRDHRRIVPDGGRRRRMGQQPVRQRARAIRRRALEAL